MEPQIIFQDDDILVIDKPAGMVVNKADTTRYVSTVQEWTEKQIGLINSSKIYLENAPEFEKRGGVVHRLDKETSGILVLAKNQMAFENLQKQFKERVVKKVYTALVHGKVEPKEGEIEVPIGRLPWNRTKFGVLAEGRDAKTLYKVIENKKYIEEKEENDLSLVELYPATGRTHQIRVHMRHIGFPLFSDELYAGRKQSKRDRKILPRHFLHASKITFQHPTTGITLTFESPLPKDLSDFLNTLE